MFSGQTTSAATYPPHIGLTGSPWAGKKGAGATAKRRVNSATVVASDISQVCPEDVVASSHDLGWQNVRAVRVRHSRREVVTPPMDSHCVVIQLWPSLHVSARIGERPFDRHMRPGDIAIVPAGTPSEWRWRVDRPSNTLHLYLSPAFLRSAAESNDLNNSQAAVIEPQFGVRDEHIRHIGMSLLHELSEANIVGRLYADSLATVLAMQLIRRYSYFQNVQVSRGGMSPRKLRTAIEFMNDNLNREQDVSIPAVAEAVGMSYFHFSRVFKQSMSISPNNYLIKRRIERAKKFLAETDIPVIEIALRIGFTSQSHFTTTFRRLVGATPKAYRDLL
jgi:AraC family transcriptional regulator